MVKAHVSKAKKIEVKYLTGLFNEYDIIGVVNIMNLPAPQFQNMRQSLRGKALIRVGKRRLMKIALEQAKAEKKGIEHLEQHLDGIMPAFIFTNENPFALARILNTSTSSAPAKAGQTAPKDLWVKAGLTPFAPGPIIGDLGTLGIQTSIDAQKIKIDEDCCIVKEGEIVSSEAASVLSRLGVKPMEIGLDLRAVYEAGEVLLGSLVFVDEKEFRNEYESIGP